MYFQCVLVVISFESFCILSQFHQIYLYNLVTQALLWHHNGCWVLLNNQVMWPNVYNVPPLYTWAAEKQLGLTTSTNLKSILWYHDRIEIDTSFSVMVVTPQTPKCCHNLGCASVVVTFGSLWCHSHYLKFGINSFNTFLKPHIGQIFGHQRAEIVVMHTKMNKDQETHPIRENYRYEINWAHFVTKRSGNLVYGQTGVRVDPAYPHFIFNGAVE